MSSSRHDSENKHSKQEPNTQSNSTPKKTQPNKKQAPKHTKRKVSKDRASERDRPYRGKKQTTKNKRLHPSQRTKNTTEPTEGRGGNHLGGERERGVGCVVRSKVLSRQYRLSARSVAVQLFSSAYCTISASCEGQWSTEKLCCYCSVPKKDLALLRKSTTSTYRTPLTTMHLESSSTLKIDKAHLREIWVTSEHR